jgi:hypothetical protein
MKSGNEDQTHEQLQRDLQLEAEHAEQIKVTDKDVAKEEAERDRLAAVRAATQEKVNEGNPEYEALENRLLDALIDGGETDAVAVVRTLDTPAALLRLHVKMLRRITEDRMGSKTIDVLTVKKKRAVLGVAWADDRLRVHNGQLLLAAAPAGEIGGDLTIRSAVAQRLAHELDQAAFDLQQATQALENEIAQQKKIRDARTNRGPVSYQNPS